MSATKAVQAPLAFLSEPKSPGWIGAPTASDRMAITSFVAFQFVRGASFRATHNKLADFMWAVGHPESSEIETHQNDSIRAALDLAPQAFDVLMTREWNIIRFEEPVLVTSDEPVSMWHALPEEEILGTGLADCDEVRLPLDPQHMLVLTLGTQPFELGLFATMPAEPWAERFNYVTTFFSHRWVIASPSHPELEHIRELARETPRRGIRVQLGDEVTDIIPEA